MAKFLVRMDERVFVTYEVEADNEEEAAEYAEYEAGEDCIVDRDPVERSFMDCEEK